MLDLAKTQTLSKSLYTTLKVGDFFKKSNFHERYQYQIIRLGYQFNTLSRKYNIAKNYGIEYLSWINNRTLEPPMTTVDFSIELSTLLCSFGLAHYELLKRFLLEVLDVNKMYKACMPKNSTKRSRNQERITYGQLVNLLQECPNFTTEMLEMLDVDLRNALAHDTWYFSNNQIAYMNLRKQTINISFEKFPQKIFIITQAYTTISNCYMKDYESDTVETYNKIGSKEFNKIFPLYGMND